MMLGTEAPPWPELAALSAASLPQGLHAWAEGQHPTSTLRPDCETSSSDSSLATVQVNDQKHEKNILAKTCTKGNECTVCTWLDTRMPRNMFVVLIF